MLKFNFNFKKSDIIVMKRFMIFCRIICEEKRFEHVESFTKVRRQKSI